MTAPFSLSVPAPYPVSLKGGATCASYIIIIGTWSAVATILTCLYVSMRRASRYARDRRDQREHAQRVASVPIGQDDAYLMMLADTVITYPVVLPSGKILSAEEAQLWANFYGRSAERRGELR